jgi:hypothetical protein
MEDSERMRMYEVETMDHKTLVMAENTKDAVIKFFQSINNLREWVETNKIGGAIVITYNDTNVAMSTIPLLLNLKVLGRKEAIRYIRQNTSMNPSLIESFINSEIEKYRWVVEND